MPNTIEPSWNIHFKEEFTRFCRIYKTSICSGSFGAGIGGVFQGAGGNITIAGGTVTATGGIHASGIGGGIGGSGGTVTIKGINASVTARGTGNGKDIGSGGSISAGGTLEVLAGAAVDINNTDALIQLSLSDLTANGDSCK